VTTNVTAKTKSQLHFCTKQITAVQYSGLTRAAVKLLLFKDNDLSYSIQPVITIKITDTPQGKNVGQKQLTTFRGFWKLAKC